MRIGIVNDSLMATEVLRRIVTTDEEHEILWFAENGAEAVECCLEKRPDLILMDIMMPVMNGIEATRQIMQRSPCAILVVTATVTGHSSEVFEAMGAGALDAIATPVLGTAGSMEAGKELRRKITMIGNLIGCKASPKKDGLSSSSESARRLKNRHIVLIGCSTGGPQALIEILSHFPKDVDAAFIIIQHMDKKFNAGLASWLDGQIALPVRIIKEGSRPLLGTVLIPDTDNHLVMKANSTLGYTETIEENFYHPSVDVFFTSTAHSWYGKIIGVLLTGMGKDGAQGLLTIKQKGWHTIVQDRETSVVFGMPKAALELGAAGETLPVQKIGPRILELLQQK